MKPLLTIAFKELKNYLSSPTGYVFTGLLLIVSNWLFLQDFFLVNVASLMPLWGNLGFLLSIFIPALAMNSISEEKRNGNWEVILSLPVSEVDFVLGKFVGNFAAILFTLLFFLPTTLLVVIIGKPDVGIVFGGWLGIIFLASTYLAIGIFASALSNQAVVGFVVAAVGLLINNFVGQESVLQRLPGTLSEFVGYLSITAHTSQLSTGLVTVSNLVFFTGITTLFLTLTVLWLKLRNA